MRATLCLRKKPSRRSAHGGAPLYLTGSEGDPVVELHAVLLLAVIQPLPADADGHGSQIVVNPEIVLMLWWGQVKKMCELEMHQASH